MVKTATSQDSDTKMATEMAESKRRQTKTATSQNGDKPENNPEQRLR